MVSPPDRNLKVNVDYDRHQGSLTIVVMVSGMRLREMICMNISQPTRCVSFHELVIGVHVPQLLKVEMRTQASLKYLQSTGQGKIIGGAGIRIDNTSFVNCNFDRSPCRERERGIV